MVHFRPFSVQVLLVVALVRGPPQKNALITDFKTFLNIFLLKVTITHIVTKIEPFYEITNFDILACFCKNVSNVFIFAKK